ncbi:unnamed protein product [Discosporangium mesarthrocarpum]
MEVKLIVHGLALVWVLNLTLAFPVPKTSQWLKRAVALQSYLGYDIEVDQFPRTATHNSYSWDGAPTTHLAVETVSAQKFNVTMQLEELGVRGLELDPRYVEELTTAGRTKADSTLLCHVSKSIAPDIYSLCKDVIGFETCTLFGAPDFGEDDTGCNPSAPTLASQLKEINSWLSLPSSAQEVIVIKLDSNMDDETGLLSTIIGSIFGQDIVFSVGDYFMYSRQTTWPTSSQLLGMGKRVIVFAWDYSIKGDQHSSLVHINPENLLTVPQFAVSMDCHGIEGAPEPSWTRVQGDVQAGSYTFGNITHEYLPSPEDFLAPALIPPALLCGLTPTIDRINPTSLGSTVWSWSSGHPALVFTEEQAAVASALTGRWTAHSTTTAGEAHRFACRSFGNRLQWTVSATAGGFQEGVSLCPEGEGYVFGAPRTAFENQQLIRAMRGVGADQVWLNYISLDDNQGSGGCWSREGNPAFCYLG